MKLPDSLKAYREYSAKASDVSRQLAFAGLAVVWIFKTDVKNGGPKIPTEFVPATIVLILALTFDLFQYVSATVVWGIFNRGKEKAGTKLTDEFGAPRAINWPANSFFTAKLIALAVAYGKLLCLLAGKLVG